jgi:holin-like protein
MKVIRVLGQVLILVAFNEAGRWIAGALQIPIPGSLIGMALLLLLLATRLIRMEWVEAGAALLLSEMLLFFIPAAVQVVDFGGLLSQSGVRLVGVIVCSTVTVMVGVGLVTDRIVRWKQGGWKWRQGTRSSH